MALNFTSHLNRDMSPFITKAKDHKVDASLWTRIGEKTTKDNKTRRVNAMNANVADILSRADEDLYEISPEDVDGLVAKIDDAISSESKESDKAPEADETETDETETDETEEDETEEDETEEVDAENPEDTVDDETEETVDETEVTDGESMAGEESGTDVLSEENSDIQKEIDELSKEERTAYRQWLVDNQLKDSPEAYAKYKTYLESKSQLEQDNKSALVTDTSKKSFLDMLPETGSRQPDKLTSDPNINAQPREFNYGPSSFLSTIGQTRQPQLLTEDPNAKLKNQKPNRTFLQMISR